MPGHGSQVVRPQHQNRFDQVVGLCLYDVNMSTENDDMNVGTSRGWGEGVQMGPNYLKEECRVSKFLKATLTLRHSRQYEYKTGGSVAEWLARRTRDLEVAGSIPDYAMLQLP
ncbi:hypothetical protein ElyMa_001886200 [Elysia marginata]|uniref:DEP domain-containing protein n=1 Tax=Elysia marginata TaxID=1093978 RepID=A0AAV4EPT5_9GAST|nr:hypothetical protein ElyMa_001886200 [Elysia marginata]